MNVALILLSLFLAWEDHKTNSIPVWSLIVHYVLCFIIFYTNGCIWQYSLVSFTILLLIYSSLTLYFSIKLKAIVNITNQFIGLGDVLWILALSLIMKPKDLLLFLIIGQVVSLITYQLFYKKRAIPFLVGMGGTLILFLMKAILFN